MPRPLVSVVIPCFDVEHYVDGSLRSLVAQSIGFDAIEVIAVDDGSRDRTGELLDAFAADRDNVLVLHQENSGGPGGPRNRGVRHARGDHLFFLDPDDHLAPEALERLVAAAERNDSDVVLGKMVGVGRGAPTAPFARDVEQGDVWSTRAIWSLSAQKLFRRSFVTSQNLRFVERSRLAEDQPFVVEAYLTARCISVVASYPCYYLVLRDDGGNATRTPIAAAQFYDNVGQALRSVEAHVEPGPRRDQLLARFFMVEICAKVTGYRFLDTPPELRRQLVEHIQPLAVAHFPEESVDGFPALDRVRGHLLRQGDLARLEELARFETTTPRAEPQTEEDGRTYARLPGLRTSAVPDRAYDITDELALDHCRDEVRWEGDALRLVCRPYAPALTAPGMRWSLIARSRGDAGAQVVAMEPAPGGSVEAVLRPAGPEPGALPDATWDLAVRVANGTTRRERAVGSAGALSTLPEPAARLAGGRRLQLRRSRRGHVLLDVASSGRIPVRGAVRFDAGRIELSGVVGLPVERAEEWQCQVVLRERAGPGAVSGSADSTAGRADSTFAGAVGPEGVGPGTWDAWLLLHGAGGRHEGRVHHEGPLPEPVVVGTHGGLVVVPHVTRHGNLSLTAHPLASWAGLRHHVDGVTWARNGVLRLRGSLRLRLPTASSAQYSVVLRDERTARDVVVPLGAAGPVHPVDVELDLARLARHAGLGPGRWRVLARAEVSGVGLQVPAQRRSGVSLTEAPRWYRPPGGRPLRARPLVAGRDLVLEVAAVPVGELARLGRRLLGRRLLGRRLRGRR